MVVPAGVPHSEGNPGTEDIEGIVELRLALRAKEWHEALAGLVADFPTTPRGAPRNVLQLGRESGNTRPSRLRAAAATVTVTGQPPVALTGSGSGVY